MIIQKVYYKTTYDTPDSKRLRLGTKWKITDFYLFGFILIYREKIQLS